VRDIPPRSRGYTEASDCRPLGNPARARDGSAAGADGGRVPWPAGRHRREAGLTQAMRMIQVVAATLHGSSARASPRWLERRTRHPECGQLQPGAFIPERPSASSAAPHVSRAPHLETAGACSRTAPRERCIRDNFPLSGVYPHCYNSASWQEVFLAAASIRGAVQDHLGSHRRLAFRAAAVQAAVALLAGAVASASAGRIAGFAAAIGAASVALASVVQAQLALGGGIAPPGVAFARLLLGTLAKWLVIVAVWWGAIAIVGKAPIAAVAGLLAALLAHPLVVLLGTKVKRER
jgi:hypothetical protein